MSKFNGKLNRDRKLREETAKKTDMQLAHKLYDLAARLDDEKDVHAVVESAQRLARTLTMMQRERVN